jgi:O-acetyl-ADP-ribose deacetylase (regulator of RNase III)
VLRVEYKSIFDTDCEAVVNPVNCYGISGAGLAAQFKRHFYYLDSVYVEACSSKKLLVNDVLPVKNTGEQYPNIRYVIYFPTKNHWKEPAKYSYVDAGLRQLEQTIKTLEIKSIALPMLGAGLGGLDPRIIREYIYNFAFRVKDFCTVKLYIVGKNNV